MKDIELKDLKESMASLQQEYKKLQGAMSDMPMEDKMKQHMNSVYDTLYRMNDNMYNQMDKIHAKMNDHMGKGHLPPMTPGQMSTALAKLGMDGDHQVAKHMVVCAGRNNVTIEVEYQKPKE